MSTIGCKDFCIMMFFYCFIFRETALFFINPEVNSITKFHLDSEWQIYANETFYPDRKLATQFPYVGQGTLMDKL